MATYCRLCAEEKSDDDLCASINDLKSGILEKLSACCQWNSYAVNPELPDRVCSMCSEKLEKCWIFSECVSSAQIKLQQLFDDGELTINNETEEDLICDNAESIFVEPITLPDIYPEPSDDFIESTDDLIGSTIENVLDESMSMRECDICQKVFTTGYNLTVHKRAHTNERPYVCTFEECAKQFKSSSNLNQHLRQVHERNYQSTENKPDEPSATAVVPVEKEPKLDKVENSPNTENFKYACHVCERRFRLRCTLIAHRTIHSNERNFECTFCHRAFKRMKLLRVHTRIHTQYPSIPCPICGKLFRRNCQRDAHIKERHGVPAPKKEKKPPAPPRKPVRRYTCELCGMSFTQKGGLFSHMTVHSDNRPHKCDICNLGFKRKRTMQDHRKTHTNANEHKCTQCDKTFRKKISLHRHLEYHTGSVAKPFVCDFCGKGFRLNANLVEHRRIHTGEKPYFCEHCGSTFRTMSSFYSHLKKEHGISVMARKIEEQARATAMTQLP